MACRSSNAATSSSCSSVEARKSSQRIGALFIINAPISWRDALRVVPPDRIQVSSTDFPRRCAGLMADSGILTSKIAVPGV